MAVKFFNTSSGGTGGGGSNIQVKQVDKLGVVAPHETVINIPFTEKFDKLPIEVLKLIGGQTDILKTLCNFDNADATDFEENEYVEFDGVMKLKTDYSFQLTSTGPNTYEFDLSKLSDFAKIESISVV